MKEVNSLLFAPQHSESGIGHLKNKQDLMRIRYIRVAADFNCLLGSPFHTTWVSPAIQVCNEQAVERGWENRETISFEN